MSDLKNKFEPEGDFEKNFGKPRRMALFVDENWISPEIVEPVKKWIEELGARGLLKFVVILRKDDFNTFGILNVASQRFGYEEDINSIMAGDVKELVLIGDDVIRKITGDNRFKPENFDFLCMVKKFSDGYAKFAHLVFPQRSFMEKNGSLTNVLGTVQKLRKALRITQENIEEWKMIAGLGNILGLRTDYADEADIYREMAKSVESYPKEFSKIKGAEKFYNHYDRELRK